MPSVSLSIIRILFRTRGKSWDIWFIKGLKDELRNRSIPMKSLKEDVTVESLKTVLRTDRENIFILLWKLQYRIIRELAEKEPCVIVGRCADFILQDRTDCLNVFVHADMKFRADRIVRVYGEREKSPEARLKKKDKRRAAYYRFYTDMKWGDAANYHVALDSGVIGIEKCAKVIESLGQHRTIPA